MEDSIPRCPVFCTAEIPSQIFESFLEDSRESLLEYDDDPDISESLVLMTSKDLSQINHGMSSPVHPFTSPFLGYTIDEVVLWFAENLHLKDVNGFEGFGFILLDSESVEQEICKVVCLVEEPYEMVRCDFTMGLSIANLVNLCKCLDDTGAGPFKNSGMVMTEERYKIVSNGGMYLDGMEVKYDEYWRNFIEEWS